MADWGCCAWCATWCRLQGSRGANAREIADAFLDSPLMSQLSDDRGPRRRPVAEEEEEDMGLSRDRSTMNLGGWVRREGREAGGAAASVGSSRSEGQAERRRYQHWVGDYGPLHTRAVREQEDDEEEDRDDPRSEAGEGKGERPDLSVISKAAASRLTVASW